MFQGLTIDELINSVERAEQHARQTQVMPAQEPQSPVYRMEWQPVTEVA